jgi:hypothetical protein
VRRSTDPNWPQPGQEKLSHGTPAGGHRSADRRVEPERTPAGLARLPDSDDPLSLSDRLALGLLALRFGPCSIAFLRAAVRAPGKGYRSKRNRQ